MPDAPQYDQQALESLVGRALALAKAGGATAAEAGVGVSTGLSVTVRLGEVETLEYQRDRSLGITVYSGHRKGSASTANLTPAAIEETVAKALSIASFTAEDEYAGLADPETLATDPPDLDLYRAWDIDAESAETIALAAEQAARDFDPRIRNSEGASVATGGGVRAYANSHGFVGSFASSSHSISLSVLAGENGSLERDYWYTQARHPGDLEAAEAIGRKAAERAVRRLHSRQVGTQQAFGLYPNARLQIIAKREGHDDGGDPQDNARR